MNFTLKNFIRFDPQHKTILVVDDDPTNLEIISTWLQKENFSTLAARNGNRALQSAVNGQPNLILLDVMMPDIDGFEVCQRLKSNSSTQNIPVIFMTALTETEEKVRGFQAGAVDYITKPIHEEEFFARVVTHLNLQEFNNQLEQKVAQRTQELTLTNQQLQAEISKRQQVSEALQKNEERLGLALTAVNDGLFDWDMQTNEAYFSPRYYTMLGYDPNEMPASEETWLKLLHPDDRAAAINMVQETTEQSRDIVEIEFRMRAKSGEWRWILSRGKIMEHDENGQPVRMVGTHTDITVRKRAEQLLTALNQAALSMERAVTPADIFAAVAKEFKKLGLYCIILLIDETQTKLLPKHFGYKRGAIKAAEKLANFKAENFSITIDSVDVVREVIKNRKTLFVTDALETVRQALPKALKKWAPQIVKILNGPQYISAPLIVDDEVIGMFSVQSTDLTAEDLPAITASAYQIAAAWRKTQLFAQAQLEITERKRAEEELSQRNRELALLNRVIAASASNLEPEAILEIVCTELAQTFDLPHTSAALLDEAEMLITIVAECRAENQPKFVGIAIAVEDVPLIQQKIPEKKPVIIEDVQTHPDMAPFQALFVETEISSLALFPLLIEQKLIGSLNLFLTEKTKFSDEEYNLAQNVAEQVASTLARVQLSKSHQQLEEQYRQSQKMEAIGRLAGGMAHDFNNLLTVITGYTELLLYRHIKKDTPEYREIEQIHKAGKRASTLTRQLLAFSRQQVIQPKELDLNAIINDINEMIRRLISENIDLVTILDPVLGRIKADPGQIEQIIVNLVVNAYDAMPQGGKLTIQTTNIDLDAEFTRHYVGLNPGEYVKFTISDTGIGMDEKTQLHIFEPFFTTKAQGKGTGLGLSMVYGIVQQNEGYITVQSQPGAGTAFDIYLPRLARAKDALSEGQTETGSQPGTETILLVEDEDMVRQLARYALREHGYHILEAQNAQDALNVCAGYEGAIDLLLTDVVMPGKLSGRELAKQLETQYPEMKIMYMSGYTDDTIVRHGIIDANLTFLQKPFSPTTLARKVREVLDSRSVRADE